MMYILSWVQSSIRQMILFKNSSKFQLRIVNMARIIYSFVFSAAISFRADITTDAVRTNPAPSNEIQFAYFSQNLYFMKNDISAPWTLRRSLVGPSQDELKNRNLGLLC